MAQTVTLAVGTATADGADDDPVMTVVPGWHFNVRSGAPIEWPASVTQSTPVTPWRVWG